VTITTAASPHFDRLHDIFILGLVYFVGALMAVLLVLGVQSVRKTMFKT
jgi:hypothetical protein